MALLMGTLGEKMKTLPENITITHIEYMDESWDEDIYGQKYRIPNV